MIEVKNLTKTYENTIAVDEVSFSIQEGEIFGLLGPNGAGKTSMLECMEGLREPTSGYIKVGGIDPSHDPRKVHNLIGVQLQSAALPESITPSEAMRIFCAYHSVPPRLGLLEELGLMEKKDVQFLELSSGQKQRLFLALAVAHNPKVLFLDEPTAGLDVSSRFILHDLIKELKSKNTTIFLATHDMAEADQLSDRVGIIVRGKLITIGTPLEITATGSCLTKISVRSKNDSMDDAAPSIPDVERWVCKDDYKIFFSTNITSTISAIIAAIETHKDTLIDLRVERPSLEDRFLEITQTNLIAGAEL
jgi:ABC-2 type transport system ATP-binding protein